MKPKLSWFHLKDAQNVFEVKMRSFFPLQVDTQKPFTVTL